MNVEFSPEREKKLRLVNIPYRVGKFGAKRMIMFDIKWSHEDIINIDSNFEYCLYIARTFGNCFFCGFAANDHHELPSPLDRMYSDKESAINGAINRFIAHVGPGDMADAARKLTRRQQLSLF
ncbi:MAG: BCIP domain-containing protein [Desulfobulbaceae bacterium]|nr:BCIP domain-containing protein [Desulfobulbaceae bacterium]